MRALLASVLFVWSLAVQADYCLSWVNPTENTNGTPLTDHAGTMIWCIPVVNTYGQPNIINDPTVTTYFKEWPSPAGDWKCKLRAFNSAGIESADSNEVLFTLLDQDGDGNPEVVGTDGSCTFQPPIIIPPIPSGPASMKITRKGYYTITDPGGELVPNEDGGIRQVTSRDKAYEYITQLTFGIYTINPPLYEVEWKQ